MPSRRRQNCMEELIYLLSNIFNLLIASLALILFILYVKKKSPKFNILPRSLRWYLNTCFFPFAMLFNLQSICISALYLAYRDPSRLDFKIIRVTLIFTSNQLRLSLLTTMIERIIATIYLERYGKHSGSIWLYIILSISSFTLSAIYTSISMLWIFGEDASLDVTYVFTVYILIAMHILTLIICRVLHVKSRKMHKTLAYRVSLKRRHEIVINIKILTFLWPTIFVFSALGPTGPFLVWLYHTITASEAPVGILQACYNATFMIMMIIRLKIEAEKKRPSKYANVTQMRIMAVTSPLGQILPTTMTSEVYFEQLKKQWS